ncbi:phenylalanine--tRNA ligase subunit beta [Oleomonas cavernae]|uniref:Phenylalanine--tRNA ligase beta subunit n=1 Tax=Oleomonas cavernae TaxID=2320859 RepID=A0A418WG54_9PROT|nr:phenylalanine--tRNA ligase subunit beta [Oleomonas cavernae]RJF88996.1 phenylalanine--tRNA ligase subunit beta [Oleomonas cavernae]
MKITVNWLKEHLETAAGAQEIAERLTSIGLEVEGIEDRAAVLKPFTVAYVVEAVQHPNADKLRLCTVDAGDGTPYQVVCGAPNARTGLKVVFARMGTTIPGNGMVLKPTAIRGVDSQGMMCSMREMGLGQDHDGIIELPEDAPIGKPFAEVLGLDDAVIDLSVTPNRQDCLGVSGIARDLAAAGLGTLITPAIGKIPGTFPSTVSVRLDESVKDKACPLFVGRLIKGVTNGDSPAWLKARLEAIGLRPISALVDITNLITHDRARPLHVFDAAKLTGGIHVRFGKAGESVEGLDGKAYALDEQMIVVADDAGPLGLGGIVGGVPSSVTGETVDVFLEAAHFDALTVAATGRRLGVVTDARHRFERGVDPQSAFDGIELGTKLILELCGGEASEIVFAGAPPAPFPNQTFRPFRVEKLTGLKVADERMVEILADLGFGPDRSVFPWNVSVPSWRRDIEGEVDLVEEVARITGLDKLPVEPLPSVSVVPLPALNPAQRRVRAAKRLLATRGLTETVNNSFIPEAHAAAFGWSDLALKVANPISVELAVMRPHLVPSLAAAAVRNAARGIEDVALFEVAGTYHGIAPKDQASVAGGIRTGYTTPRQWQGGRRAVDAFDAKADVLALLGELGAPVGNLTVGTDVPAWLHPGQAGTLKLGPKTVIAVFGALHPRMARLLGVEGPAVVFEVYLDAIPAAKAKPTREKPALVLSDFQAVSRDFAFLVDETVAAEAVIRAIKGADKALIADVSVFDLYRGQGVPAGKVSMALAVRLEPRDKTLTEPEIEAVSAKIVAAVAKATGGSLRG